MKIKLSDLKRIVEQESRLALIAEIEDDQGEYGDLVQFPMEPKLPWEFGPQGYIKRPELRDKMSRLEYGSDSAPEDILAIALSNRAEELMGYKKTIEPEPFSDLAMKIYQDYVVGKSGDLEYSLSDITSRIDAGDYFDDYIDLIYFFLVVYMK